MQWGFPVYDYLNHSQNIKGVKVAVLGNRLSGLSREFIEEQS